MGRLQEHKPHQRQLETFVSYSAIEILFATTGLKMLIIENGSTLFYSHVYYAHIIEITITEL